jgi:hypothetical protein
MAEFGSQLAFQGEKQFNQYIELKTANEISAFKGEVAGYQRDYQTYLASNPNASMEEMQKAKGVMMDRISGASGNMTLGTSKRFASSWHLQNRGDISGYADYQMARIGTQNEYNNTLAQINEMTAAGNYEGVRELAMAASGQNFQVNTTPTRFEEPEQEEQFQQAYSAYSASSGASKDPDDPKHFYDYRGLFKGTGAITPDSEGHLPSKYKLAGHPNTFVDGVHTPTGSKFTPGVLSVDQANYLISKSKDKASKMMVTQIAEKGLTDAIDYAVAGEMELSDKVIRNTHAADQVEGAMDDRDAFIERIEKRQAAASQAVSDEQLQLIRDDALGVLAEGQEPVTMHTLNKLRKKDRETPGTGINEDQYQELVKALNGENTAYDVSNPRVQRKVLDQIKDGAISSDGIRLLHGRGLSTADVESYGKQADARLKAGAATGMDKELYDDLETLKKSGFFIWGQDQDWPEMYGDEEKPADMSFEDRMQNTATFVKLEAELNRWLMENPNATDAQKQEHYDRMVDPARVHVSIGWLQQKMNMASDEQEIRREKQWKNLRENGELLSQDMADAKAKKPGHKTKEELDAGLKSIEETMDPEYFEAWQEYQKTVPGATWERYFEQLNQVKRGA